jgi:hypothetical protein
LPDTEKVLEKADVLPNNILQITQVAFLRNDCPDKRDLTRLPQ